MVELHCLVFVYVAHVLLYEEGLLVVAADRGSATNAVGEGDYERTVGCFLEADQLVLGGDVDLSDFDEDDEDDDNWNKRVGR